MHSCISLPCGNTQLFCHTFSLFWGKSSSQSQFTESLSLQLWVKLNIKALNYCQEKRHPQFISSQGSCTLQEYNFHCLILGPDLVEVHWAERDADIPICSLFLEGDTECGEDQSGSVQVKSFLTLVAVNNKSEGTSALSHRQGTGCLGNSFSEKYLGGPGRHLVEHEPAIHPLWEDG